MKSNFSNGVELKYIENDEIVSMYFNSKYELRNNSYLQKILSEILIEKEKGVNYLKCNCNDTKVNMSIRQNSESKIFYLANLPNNGYNHSIDCIYYNHLENLIDSNDRYKDLIFKELEYLNFKKSSQTEIINHTIKDKHRKKTFNNFCMDFISQSMSMSFYRVNSKATKREELKYPSFDDFLMSFSLLMDNNNLMSNSSIKDNLDSDSTFNYGLIKQDIFNQSKELENEQVVLNLPIIKKQFDVSKNFKGYYQQEIKVYSNKKTIEETQKLVQIFNNFISPPYFFIAIIKKNSKGFNRLVRFYIKPIYYDMNYLVFVDSGFERNYAKKLILEKIPFIKPLQNSCFNVIKKDFVNYKRGQNVYKRAFLQFLPDFIEFLPQNIVITEVSGYTDNSYIQHLNRKKEHYLKECNKSKGLYKYNEVIGS